MTSNTRNASRHARNNQADEAAAAKQTTVSGDSTAVSSGANLAEEKKKARKAKLRKAAKKFLRRSDPLKQVLADVERLGIVGEGQLIAPLYLIGTSRLAEEPLAAVVISSSGSGKSHVAEKVFQLFPQTQTLKATDMTPNALYYLEPGSLEHKFVYLAERRHVARPNDAAAANRSLPLREIISSGELRKLVTMKVKGQGTITKEVYQRGPIAYLETTTQEEIFDEDQSRLIALHTDESPEQTRRIVTLAAQQAAVGIGSENMKRRIIAKHRRAQRMLRRLSVRVPFAPLITIRTNLIQLRRAFPQLVRFIRAMALLRQFSKEAVDGEIDADLEDYRLVHECMAPIFAAVFSPIPHLGIALYETLRTHRPAEDSTQAVFTLKDALSWSGLRRATVEARMTYLLDAGAVERIGPDAGPKTKYVFAPGADAIVKRETDILTTPEELEAALAKQGDTNAAREAAQANPAATAQTPKRDGDKEETKTVKKATTTTAQKSAAKASKSTKKTTKKTEKKKAKAKKAKAKNAKNAKAK